MLQKATVLEVVPRSHGQFRKISPDPLHKLKRNTMHTWIKKKAREFSRRDRTTMNNSDTEDDIDNTLQPAWEYSDPYAMSTCMDEILGMGDDF